MSAFAAPTVSTDGSAIDRCFRPLSRAMRLTYLLAFVIPFLGVFAAIVSVWGWGFDWLHMALLLGMWIASGLGVTVGFHRLFTHRSFEAVRPVRFLLAVLGSMALEGPVLKWVAQHRCHHQHSDEDGDPHSPHLHGGHGVLEVLRGLWHAHLGWIFAGDRLDLARYVPDLRADRIVRWVSASWMLWAAAGLLLPAALGWLIGRTWLDALLGFVWGGLVRVFIVHHLTFSINSICHFWGSHPFHTHDQSRNNLFFGIVGFGEGWHNNHHAFPTSARHGLHWWQIDISYWIIRAMEAARLAWRIRVPAAEAIATKRQ